MKLSNVGSILATLTHLTQLNRTSALTHRVKDLSVSEFICFLDFITAEFQQFLRAIEMINNEALESMLEQVMEAFTLKIGQILQADRTIIFLVDTEKGQLWAKIPQGEANKPLEVRIPLNVGLAGHVATTSESINIPDAYNHPLFNKEVDERPGYHTKTLLCMPIFSSSQQVVAVVQLLNKAGDVPFDNEDEQRFRDLAASIGIVLETCQSFYMASRNQRGAAALLKATASLGQSLDLEATLRLVMEQARELMQADRSTLFMLSKETGELWSKVATADGKDLVEIRIPANRGIVGYVASTGQTLNIPDAYKDPHFDPTTDKRTGYVTRNILCMPVFNSGGDLIGVTQLINKHQGSFSSSDEEFMRAFNIQAGIALENAKLFENVLIEKQYQKDILQSLSDAVISTDMQSRIVTINEAALALLGCPPKQIDRNDRNPQLWEYKLTGRYVWEVVPIEHLQTLLQDSLSTGAKHYVPEQSLTVGLFEVRRSEIEVKSGENHSHSSTYNPQISYILAIRDRTNPNIYIPWNEPKLGLNTNPELQTQQVKELERTVNLTINPLTNPEGGVRGGLVVLEDINQEKRMRTSFPNRMVSTDKASHMIAVDESTKRLLSLSEEDSLKGQLIADANNEQQVSPVSLGIGDEKQLKSTNDDAISFPSLSSLRSAHSELLKRYRESGSTTDLLAEMEEFICRGRATGALLDTDEDRWASQSLLDYWSAILYRAGREPPDATLAEFDSALAPELDEARCPYLGLEAFQEEKSSLFYGRQRLLEKLVNHLKENRVLAVVGSSGSGKSSVVLGGLLPKLKAGGLSGSENWHYYSPMVPGANPLENLARLTQPLDVNATEWLQQQVESFQEDPNHFTKLSNEFSNRPCVLVVDQFEEVFTLCRDDNVRQAFIDNLIGLIESPGIRHTVILTMRTDFESQVARVPIFKDLFEHAQVRVTALDASELREAIEKPAELYQMEMKLSRIASPKKQLEAGH